MTNKNGIPPVKSRIETSQTAGLSTDTLDLVRRAQAGDPVALNSLFERYLPRVRQIVGLRLKHRSSYFDDFEDLVQESLLKALKSLDTFHEKSEGTFRNWMSHCVQSVVIDQGRAGRAKKRGGGNVRRFSEIEAESLTSTVFAGQGPSPAEVACKREMEEQLEQAIWDLDEHYREAIILRSLCEMSYADVAEAMGFAQEATARKVCSRAVKKLRERLVR